MLALVSHDAGGAEVLSSYVRRNGMRYVLTLEGPARSIFTRKLGAAATVGLEEALQSASWLLCGTSWQSDLEWRALRLARESGKRSVAFLDHWVNYRERFQRQGETHLPDEIWVCDEYAARIAGQCFEGVPVRMVGNPYLDDVRAEIDALPKTVPNEAQPSVLYVCEPVREHALRQHGDERYWGYVEEEALEYFLRNVDVVAPDAARIRIRLHPSEPAGKYDWVKGRGGLPIEISTATTLVEDIAAADIVVGCESMALLVALVAGKKVISTIPPGGPPCALPYEGIQSLRNLRSA